MSRRDRWGWYTVTPKKPPPERGIRMKRSGSTWWGQRWIEALERMSSGYSNRLTRGRGYARAGRTHDLVVRAGQVMAKVTGSRATPYKVTITLNKLGDAAWAEAIAAMAAKAQFSAELLAGRMPQEIDAAFKTARSSVFPLKTTDLVTECSCPDWANPCKHVAATHYVLGDAFDRDPFLLFELRGRSKSQVLEALRAARAHGVDEQPSRTGKRTASLQAIVNVPVVSLAKQSVADYDRLRGGLPALRLSFEGPPVSGGLLRQLGSPAGWSHEASPDELLGSSIRGAAERARGLAMADDSVVLDAAGDPPIRDVSTGAGRATQARRAITDDSGSRRPWPAVKPRRR